MDARPFRLVGDTDRRTIEAMLASPVRAWAETWCAIPPDVRLECDPSAEDTASSEWLLFGEQPDRWMAWRYEKASARAMLRQLLPSWGNGSPISPLADALVRDCIADLAARCLAAAGLPGKAAGELSALPNWSGSGDQLCRLVGGAFDGTLALGGAVVEALAGARRPPVSGLTLQSRLPAIGQARLRLEVSLGEIELPLGDLVGIARGDVITLDAVASTPLRVRTESGQQAFQAHLGRNDERKVIQVSGK